MKLFFYSEDSESVVYIDVHELAFRSDKKANSLFCTLPLKNEGPEGKKTGPIFIDTNCARFGEWNLADF